MTDPRQRAFELLNTPGRFEELVSILEIQDALASDTSRAEAEQKWECEKAELLNALRHAHRRNHDVIRACTGCDRVQAILDKYEVAA